MEIEIGMEIEMEGGGRERERERERERKRENGRMVKTLCLKTKGQRDFQKLRNYISCVT